MTTGADGLTTGESPTPSADQIEVSAAPVLPDSSQQTTPVESAAPSPTPPVEDAPKDPRPRDPLGRFVPESGPDPVQEAIAKLSKAPTAPTKPAAKQPDAPAAAPKAPTEPKAPDKPAAPAASDALTTDPLEGFADNERSSLKAKTAERIKLLHNRWREAEQHAETGKMFDQLYEKHGLQNDVPHVPPEHIAGLIKVQASVNRASIALANKQQPAAADLELFKQFTATVDGLRERFGLQTPAPQAPALTPFVGELPGDLRDMVEVYGLPEAEIRLLAAVRQQQAASAKAPAPPTPPPAPAPAAVPPVPQAPHPTPAAQAPPSVVELAYSRRLAAELAQEGVNANEIGQVFQDLLTKAGPKVVALFPGITLEQAPEVFNALSAAEKYQILKEVRQQSRAKPPVPAPARTPPPPATTQRTLTGHSPRPPAPSSTNDPVQDAIALLAR